jgi:hypothetical protein
MRITLKDSRNNVHRCLVCHKFQNKGLNWEHTEDGSDKNASPLTGSDGGQVPPLAII